MKSQISTFFNKHIHIVRDVQSLRKQLYPPFLHLISGLYSVHHFSRCCGHEFQFLGFQN